MCRQLRLTSSASTSRNNNRKELLPCLGHQSRGLEQRACLERQRRKFISIRFIVKSQSLHDPNTLAALSQKCTQWASQLAVQEATRDHDRAMSSDEEEEDEEVVILESPQEENRKRSLEEEDASSVVQMEPIRRVRPRLVSSLL
mmetsp:Transcript_7491/g.15643  ORF Transcript_7491/g.15643 Transcript_7491/m.15643 type:complete len:144 (-) Transcript_7491:85-516(-)